MLLVREDFTASSGWLDRLKKTCGIWQLSITGEKFPADYDEGIDSKEILKMSLKKKI